MATRSLNVQITGDAAPLGVATRKAGQHIEDVEKRGHRMGKTLALGFAAAGAAAGGALVVGLKKSVDAAVDAQKSQARLEAQLKASGISYRAHAKQIDEVIQKHSRLAGVDDEDLQDAFTNLVRSTGSVNSAMKDMALVTDIARAKNIDVAKAGELLGKVHAGNVGVLKRYGIAFDPVTKAQDRLKESNKNATDEQIKAAKAADKQATSQKALSELQKRFGGQAEAYGKTAAGAQERFSVAVENVQEKLGQKLLPVLAKVANTVATFLAQIDSGKGAGGRFADVIGRIASTVRDVVTTLVGFGQRVKETFSGGDSSATGSVNKFVDNARTAFESIKRFVTDVVSRVSKVLGGMGDDLAIIGRAWLKIESIVSDVVVYVAQRILPRLSEAIGGLAKIVRGVVHVIAGILSGDFSKAWDGIKTIVSGAFETVKAVIRGAWDVLGPAMISLGKLAVRKLGEGLKGLASFVWGKFKDAFDFLASPSRVAAAAKDVGQTIGPAVLKGLGSLGHLLLEKFKDALEFVGNNIPGPAGALGKLIGKVTGGGTGDGIGKLNIPAFGGSLHGADPRMAPFASAASRFGLAVSSGKDDHSKYTAAGFLSYHGSGEALDFSNGYETPQEMAFARYMVNAYGGRLAELIYTPLGFSIKDGRKVAPIAASDHHDHVHVAFDLGPRGVGTGDGTGRRPFTGDGLGDRRLIQSAAGSGGVDPSILWGVWGAESGFSHGPGPVSKAGAIGPFQFMPGTAASMGVNPRDLRSSAYGAARYLGQYKGRGTSGMLAAYNAGPGGNPNNPETQAYIPAVLRFARSWQGVGGSSGSGSGGSGSGGSTKPSFTGFTLPETGSLGAAAGGLSLGAQIKNIQAGKADPGSLLSGITSGPAGKGITADDAANRGSVPEGPSEFDYLDMALANAEATAGTEDDVSALQAIVDYRTRALTTAQATGDPRQIAQARRDLTSAQNGLNDLTAALKENTSSVKASIDAMTAELKRTNDIAERVQDSTGFQAEKYLADLLSGRVARGVVGRSFTAGVGTEYAY